MQVRDGGNRVHRGHGGGERWSGPGYALSAEPVRCPDGLGLGCTRKGDQDVSLSPGRLVLPSTEVGEAVSGTGCVMKPLVCFGQFTLEVPIRHQSRAAEWMVIHASLESDVCGSRFGGRFGLEIQINRALTNCQHCIKHFIYSISLNS